MRAFSLANSDAATTLHGRAGTHGQRAEGSPGRGDEASLSEAEAIFAVDYRGISVPQAAELRASLREADATFRIVKNRLAKLAAESAGTEGLDELLEGPTALTFVKGDPVTAAKAIATFGREHDVLEFKGGFMEGAALDPDQFKSIARLPALEVLHGQLAGLTASPLTGLVRGLGSMISGLAVALGQIQEQGLVSGEAPRRGGGPGRGARGGGGARRGARRRGGAGRGGRGAGRPRRSRPPRSRAEEAPAEEPAEDTEPRSRPPTRASRRLKPKMNPRRSRRRWRPRLP